MELNSLANYLADSWTPKAGCQNCDKNRIDLTIVKVRKAFALCLWRNNAQGFDECSCFLLYMNIPKYGVAPCMFQCMFVVTLDHVLTATYIYAVLCLIFRMRIYPWFTCLCTLSMRRRLSTSSFNCWQVRSTLRSVCICWFTTWYAPVMVFAVLKDYSWLN